MKTYADANLLVRLYLQLGGSDEARELLTCKETRLAWPLPVSDLLCFEVKNALQRMVFESRTGGPWRVTPEAAAAAMVDFEDDLKAETFLRRISLSLRDIETQFTALVGRYTAKHGFRTYDVLHVSSALGLGCQKFLSFDKNAKLLAKLQGLQTN